MARSTSCSTLVISAAAVTAALSGTTAAQTSSTVVVTGRGLSSSASVAGFGDMPTARSPFQASVSGTPQWRDSGVRSIGDLTMLDASVADAYNAEGYWSIVSARGYTLDNRSNYRRDGLPINAETAIGLGNKERLELLKGASGIQAGTSAPGGLVNLVVKRPVGRIREVLLEVRQPGSALLAIDVGDRYGAEGDLGLRLNAEVERRDPTARNTRGERALLALAADARLAPDTLLQAEIEGSRQRQPSVAGFSMRGDTVPDARSIDPRLNLNDQPWRQPVVMDGTTASLRLVQRLSPDATATLQAMRQQLRTDDRTAFPYGVYDAESYLCARWCDRFSPDGTFTYWQFVSDAERRTSTALQWSIAGRITTGAFEHRIEGGVLRSRFSGRFGDQVFDIAGTGRDDGSLQTPPSAGFTDANTNRNEDTTEIFVRDVVQLTPAVRLWAGLRHSRLQRAAERTSPASEAEGLRPTNYPQRFTTPWAAASWELTPSTLVYGSWGQGIESEVAPNRQLYANASQVLPALKSRQLEVGWKHSGETVGVALALFDIDRPQTADIGPCNGPSTCTRAVDGSARHRGAEASGTLRGAVWTLQVGAMWLDAERRGATAVPQQNGLRPVNVPQATLRLGGEYRPPSVAGLALLAQMSADGDRVVSPGTETARIPGWATLDLGLRWRRSVGATTLSWRFAVDNATNRRAWKESPYQFSHVYLYPITPRTWRASLEAGF